MCVIYTTNMKMSDKSVDTRPRKSASDRELFLEKWQKIEDAVITRAHMTDHNGFVKAFDHLVKSDTLLAQKASLVDDLRALRNVFSHRDRAKYIAQLEDHVLADLDDIYSLVVHPPTALQVFGCEVYGARREDAIFEVMDAMSKNVYTHVPVVEAGKIVGVFSANTFFEWAHDVLGERSDATFTKKHVRDIDRAYILPPTVYFNCIRPDVPAGSVDAIFREKTTQSVRLDCLFITRDGTKSSDILGIVTPWDLYKIR